MKFVVSPHAETGCFDKLELGPTVQRGAGESPNKDAVSCLFEDKLNRGEGIIFDGMLSEEGGRFYHEQNRNVLLKVSRADQGTLPSG